MAMLFRYTPHILANRRFEL
uniref:Uncharacterized protein n=1 Tax=Anguilla anguilla TaxID=7936 RepID=A0A0E9ST68_ANGAN